MKCRLCENETLNPICESCGFANQPPEVKKEESNSWALNLFGIVMFLGAPIAVVLVILLLVKGFPWFADNIFPITSTLSSASFLIIVPAGLFFAIFRRFRGRAGVGLVIYSYFAGLDLWVRSLAITYALTGWIGLFFAGFGVVPISMVAAAYRAQWSVLIYLAVALVFVFLFRLFGGFLIGKAAE